MNFENFINNLFTYMEDPKKIGKIKILNLYNLEKSGKFCNRK